MKRTRLAARCSTVFFFLFLFMVEPLYQFRCFVFTAALVRVVSFGRVLRMIPASHPPPRCRCG